MPMLTIPVKAPMTSSTATAAILIILIDMERDSIRKVS